MGPPEGREAMGRLVVISLLLALVGAGIWLVASGFLAGAPRSAVAPSRAAAPPPRAAAAPSPRDPDATLEVVAAEARTARQEAEPAAGAARALELLVVLAESGEPVPGASLVYAVLPAGERFREHPGWRTSTSDAWLSEHGTQARADAAGRARLELGEGALCLVAGSTEGLWGREVFELDGEPGGEPARLELGPDASIRVATVDEAGAPLAGVPVALRRRTAGWKRDALVERTGEDGRALFAHVHGLLGQRRESSWSVAAAVALDAPVEVAFEPQALPTDEVVLVLPRLGSLEVAVEPLPGGPPVGAGYVELMLHDETRSATPSFWFRPDTVRAEVADGRALFTHVGLGLELMAEAWGERSTQPTLASGPGPRRQGERAHMTVALGSDHPVLRLRVLDGEREPLRSTELAARLVTVEDGDRSSHEESRATDPEGLLWVDVPRLWGREGERALELQLASPAAGAGGRARVDLSRDLPNGLVDLGDVVLGRAEVLVTGVVLSPDGSPAAGASIEVSVPHEYGEGQVYHEPRDDLGATADAAGRFEVVGELEGDALRLGASVDDVHSAPVDCRRGAREVRLELREGGRVAGRLLLDEGVDPRSLHLVVLPADDRAQDWNARRTAQVAPGGAFEVTQVLPGLHDVRVDPRGAGEGIVVAEGVAVRSGETTRDPRLDPVDLRGRLVAFELELVPPRAGDAVVGVAEAVLHQASGGTEAQAQTLFLHGARQSFCLHASSVDLDLRVTGYRSVELRDVRGPTRVELRRGLPVRLRLVGEGELPEPPRYLKAFLSASEGPTWSVGHFQNEVFDPRREILVWAERPGRLQVTWLLEKRSDSTLWTSGLTVDPPQTIDVLDVDVEQVFEVAFPAAALAEALAEER